MTFCAVVAVPTKLPLNVPKKFVAVAAVPVKLPENTPADNTFVLGLYVSSASADCPNPEPEDATVNVMKCVALVVAETTSVALAVCANPANVPKKFVAVIAVPVTFPENVVADKTSVDGL